MIGPSCRFLVRCLMTLAFVVWPIEVSSQTPGADFSKFKHDNQNHSRLPCLLCHRRETNEPRPAMPGAENHAPCAGCHAKEFANSGHQICTICHTNAQAGTVKPFPRLSSFGMRFDHARHQRTSCASCHRPLRGGVALSIPTGFNAHTNCFGCHTPRAQSSGRDISSCGTCHQLGRTARASTAAPAFRVGFSHAKHDRSEGLSCNACHRIQAGRAQVSAPQPLHHHAAPRAFSCMSCHNGKRAFGGDDFSMCKRCHTGTRWRF
jgi:c(7)-type cytochrome triheme protein